MRSFETRIISVLRDYMAREMTLKDIAIKHHTNGERIRYWAKKAGVYKKGGTDWNYITAKLSNTL